MDEVDLFVIGGGSGGVRAARVAAQHGARVALAEADRLGGTCVIRGCVPKKLMVLASRHAQGFGDAAAFGWSLPAAPRFDWRVLRERVQAEVTRLEGVYGVLLDQSGVTEHAERAVLADAHTVCLNSGREVRAKEILIATGAAPLMPQDIPGAHLASSSNELFHWREQPHRVVVQGGGYIALEFACLLRRLGSEVTVVLRGERVLRGFDDEVRSHLQSQLAALGIVFITGAVLGGIERHGSDALRVNIDSGASLPADAVLRAIGRRPLTLGLGLEAAGVALDAAGAVVVDAGGRSTVAHIHAVGDVTSRVQLTPAAIREGQAFADRVFGGGPDVRLPHLGADGLVPSAVFTTPEVGSVGLTEAQALARHADIDIYSATFRPMKATLTGSAERTLMKLVVQRSSGRVLGCHIVGAEAAEMIQLVAVALTCRATKADLDATLAVHPTAAEELVTMRAPTRRHGTT